MEHLSFSGNGPLQSCSNMADGNTGSLIKAYLNLVARFHT